MSVRCVIGQSLPDAHGLVSCCERVLEVAQRGQSHGQVVQRHREVGQVAGAAAVSVPLGEPPDGTSRSR